MAFQKRGVVEQEIVIGVLGSELKGQGPDDAPIEASQFSQVVLDFAEAEKTGIVWLDMKERIGGGGLPGTIP